MLDYLSASNIEYIDGRSVLEDTQRDWFDYFYKSDHHPNNDAAFEIYKSVCERMSTYGYDISEEYLERDSFEITEYKDIFWGSHTRMAGPVFTGTDDYGLYLPKFDTDMEYDVPFENIHREGNFEDALCFYENLSEKSFDMYAYYAYLHQDYELIRITDNMKPDGPDIVIVRDSTAVPVSAFLSLQAHTVTLIDLRYLENYSPEEYIREINPDIIIYMFGTGYLCESDAMIIR